MPGRHHSVAAPLAPLLTVTLCGSRTGAPGRTARFAARDASAESLQRLARVAAARTARASTLPCSESLRTTVDALAQIVSRRPAGDGRELRRLQSVSPGAARSRSAASLHALRALESLGKVVTTRPIALWPIALCAVPLDALHMGSA